MTQCDALGLDDSVCQLGTTQLCQHKQLQESPYFQHHCLPTLNTSLPKSQASIPRVIQQQICLINQRFCQCLSEDMLQKAP